MFYMPKSILMFSTVEYNYISTKQMYKIEFSGLQYTNILIYIFHYLRLTLGYFLGHCLNIYYFGFYVFPYICLQVTN